MAAAGAQGYVFVADREGVLVGDVTRSERPRIVGTLPPGRMPLLMDNALLYGMDGDGGLYVCDPLLDGWPDRATPT